MLRRMRPARFHRSHCHSDIGHTVVSCTLTHNYTSVVTSRFWSACSVTSHITVLEVLVACWCGDTCETIRTTSLSSDDLRLMLCSKYCIQC